LEKEVVEKGGYNERLSKARVKYREDNLKR